MSRRFARQSVDCPVGARHIPGAPLSRLPSRLMRHVQSNPSALIALLVASLMSAPRGVPAQTAAASAATAATPMRTNRFTERHVRSADGTRIAYLVAGTGRPLVMVHGSMTVADEWLAVADRLAATRRVVVV